MTSRKVTPAFMARAAGFVPLAGQEQTWFKAETSLADFKPVGLMLRIARSRMPGRFIYVVTTDGDATQVRGEGVSPADILNSCVVALIMHEVFELRKGGR